MKKAREQDHIELSSENEKKVAEILRNDNGKYQKMLARAFKTQFTSYRDGKISIIGAPESNAHTRTIFSQLVGAVTAGQHVNGNLIEKLVNGIKNPHREQQEKPGQKKATGTLLFSAKTMKLFRAVFLKEVGKGTATVADYIGAKGRLDVSFTLPETFKDSDTRVQVTVHAATPQGVERAKHLFALLHRPAKDADPVSNLTIEGIRRRIAKKRIDPLIEQALALETPAAGAFNPKAARPAQPAPRKRITLFKPRTLDQEKAAEMVENNDLTFLLGAAGTGKTYLAVTKAVEAFRNGDVRRIVITRPYVESEEKLGFLPGDIDKKTQPYMQPIYDCLDEILGYEAHERMREHGHLVVEPLAYMRGRTFKDSFIIMDEAQNATRIQLTNFITRAGTGSKMVIGGDLAQSDLPRHKQGGLQWWVECMEGKRKSATIHFATRDIQRSEIAMIAAEAMEEKLRRENERRAAPETGPETGGKVVSMHNTGPRPR